MKVPVRESLLLEAYQVSDRRKAASVIYAYVDISLSYVCVCVYVMTCNEVCCYVAFAQDSVIKLDLRSLRDCTSALAVICFGIVVMLAFSEANLSIGKHPSHPAVVAISDSCPAA